VKFVWQRSLTLAIAALIAAGVAVARPHVVSEPLLGTEWQCSRTAFLITTCAQSSEGMIRRGLRSRELSGD
jgi:hypothetical protein